jgi:hypothetical protein
MELVNKVAESGLITINPENFLPNKEIKAFDLKDFLFMGLILKEKDYREALKQYDWTPFDNCIAAVHCSADAIIPVWAYMLCTTYLSSHAAQVCYGTAEAVKEQLTLQAIEQASFEEHSDKRIVVKGCGDVAIPDSAYLAITQKLMPLAKSIMYGEPCSTVPLYKKKSV